MNKEEIRQALVKFDREDLLYGDNDIYLDDNVEVLLTISQMIKFKNQQKQIDQLTNNWNELEEWLKEQQGFLKDTPTFLGEIYFEHKTMNNTYQNVLDKMKEIKGDNNE